MRKYVNMKTRANKAYIFPVCLKARMRAVPFLLLAFIFFACQSGNRDERDHEGEHPDHMAYENDSIHAVVAHQPSFPGGNQARVSFLQENLEYPQQALEAGIEGNVFASFVVRFDGRITDVEILRGVSGELDNEVLRVLETMDPWEPGRLEDGSPVSVRFHMPVRFLVGDQPLSQRIPRGREGEVLVIIGEEVFIRDSGQRTRFDDLIEPDQIESLTIFTDEEAMETYGYETVILITKKD
jgi:TonB family protein